MIADILYPIYLQNPKVQTDTRKLQKGDLYFALKGENFNGNHFVQEAFKMGASYAIIDEIEFKISEKCILVDDVLRTLQDLALFHRQQFDIPFIAITGSNGKTTTKELLFAVLSTTYKTYATSGNLNNHIGIPLTILKIEKDAEMAIIEMGANHLKEIEGYCKIALPTHAIINNCGKAHLEGFGGIEGVRKGKGELYDYMRNTEGTIFRNNDLDYLIEMASGINHQITYGIRNADYTGIPMLQDSFLNVEITTPMNETMIHTQLIGEYNFPNIMGAVAVGRYFQITIEKIKNAIEAYAPSNSRSQLIQKNSNFIILDAYNANPSSMQVAITNFVHTTYTNKIVMLGAMKELGLESKAEHEKLIHQLEETEWEQVVLVGGEFKDIKHSYLYFDNALEAKKWYDFQQFKDTAVLIKGSRAYAMEKIIL